MKAKALLNIYDRYWISWNKEILARRRVYFCGFGAIKRISLFANSDLFLPLEYSVMAYITIEAFNSNWAQTISKCSRIIVLIKLFGDSIDISVHFKSI